MGEDQMNETTSTSSSIWKVRLGSRPINVFSHPAFSSFLLQSAPHDWWGKARDKMDELCKLPVGWDGYFAPPVSFSVAYFAMSALALVFPRGTPEPQIVPGPNGDLQIEWHTADSDIELHFRRPNDVGAWRQTPATPNDGEEVHLSTDFRIVCKWLEEISEDSVASHSSAA
jgi:hypothetical protein